MSNLDQLSTSIERNKNFFSMFMEADSMVKLIILALFFVSIISWSVIFSKSAFFATQKKKISKFEKRVFSTPNFLDNASSLPRDNPLARILAKGFVRASFVISNDKKTDAREVEEEVKAAMRREVGECIADMEKNINFLATTASSAPFIGLFGTVWGIMKSFMSIASSKNASLAVVAPGIAEALLVTAVGLAAAIPALIFYNKFSAEINTICDKMDLFCDQTYLSVAKHHRTPTTKGSTKQ